MTRKLTITLVVLAALAAAVPSGLEAQAKPVRKAAPAAPAKLDASNVLKGMNFRSIGPTQQSGRFVDFAVPAGRPNIFYAASASGGLWKTENNGQTFEPLFENEKVFSIGDIAVAPSDPAILWLGSGEANNSRSTYWGDGIYKSVDGGKTWLNAGLRESQHIGRIVIHPSNPDIVYVAALGHLYSENLDRGVYKTTDGGKTWAQALGVTIDGRAVGAVDIVMDPSDPETLYAATYDKFRKPWTWGIGGPGSGIHKTVDGGKTWTRLSNGLPSGILGRIGLAIAPKDPKIVYAEIENANKPGMSAEDRYKEVLAGKSSEGMIDGEIYRSDDAGATWAKVSPEKRSIGGNPGYYYGQIIVDPNDSNVVYILSVGVLASRDGGKTWNSPFRFGGDNHALWIDPKDSAHMLLGYDHGMGLTWDGGKNWYHPDFLSLAQFYAIDFDMSYPYRVAGGLQDNGNLMGPSTNVGGGGGFGGRGGAAPPIRLEDWFTVGGGDGMYNVFDRTTNRTLYNESQFGPLTRVDLVTGEAESIAYQRLKPETRWNWCAPILVSAHANETIYHCGNLVVMSTNRGESWTEISPDLSTNDPSKLMVDGKGGDGNIQYCTITTFDESPLLPGVLWAGTDDGNVWVTRDNGKAWTKLNDKIAGNPGYWVSRVAASPSDPATAYVSYTGFRNDDFKPYVYKTTDYGATWTSLATGLAEGPVNVIREDPKNPKLLFAGTDFGAYVSFDGGAAWTKLKADLPTQPVQDLKIHPRENDLIVATHGRGAYIADIKALQELTPEVMGQDAHLFGIEPKPRWMGQNRRESGSSNFAGESETPGLAISYLLKSKPKEAVKVQVFAGSLLLNEIAATSDPGLNTVYWNMTGRRERTPEEKKAAQEGARRAREMGYGGAMGDPNFSSFPVQPGDYRVVLTVDGKSQSTTGTVLKDPRY
ncbi:MAG: WD40/YVTN/BNR-like repeat-containing protein [Candidatus Aminicenantales bacterium]